MARIRERNGRFRRGRAWSQRGMVEGPGGGKGGVPEVARRDPALLTG